MTRSVGVHEAKTQLSRLLNDVQAGHEVVITRRGVEVARIVPSRAKRQRTFGVDAGKLVIPDGFDDPLPAELQRFFE